MKIVKRGNDFVVTNVTQSDMQLYRLFSKTAPCWFEGCEELRREYFEEKEKLESDCPPCGRGALIRKYLARMQELNK